MNLISCWNCGVVLDKDRLDFGHQNKEFDEDSEEYNDWFLESFI